MPNSHKRRVTLKDVARESGFSVQTASHVLSGNPTVRLAESTRLKIKEAAEKLGYIANPHAQSIRSGKTNTIAIWMPTDRPIMAYLRMLQYIGEEAKKTGHHTIIVGLDRNSALTTTGTAPHRWPVDGILSIDAEKAVQKFRDIPNNQNIPVAVLGFQEFINGDSVAWNVADAFRNATQTLIDRGRKNIAHLTLDWIIEDFPREQRRRGYTEAMTAANLVPNFIISKGESFSDATEAVTEYIKKHPETDAIMAFTDALAVGAVRALIKSGKQVPQDCAVWGLGDYPESESCIVPVSTIRPPLDQVIHQSWQWLTQRIETPNQKQRFAVLEMELVERESTQIQTLSKPKD